MKVLLVIMLVIGLIVLVPVHAVLGYGNGGDGGGGMESAEESGDPSEPPEGFEAIEADTPGEDQTAQEESGGGKSDKDEGKLPSLPEELEVGSTGTLPGTRSAVVEKVETVVNDDGSVSTWVEYSNYTWVEVVVTPGGKRDVLVHLDSGKVVRPGREYIHTGGSLNPALDYTIKVLEVLAAAGTAAGWALSVTPQGALAGAGIKGAKAAWAVTVGIQSVRAGADAYGKRINQGASQQQAIATGLKQTAGTAAVTTTVGRVYGDSKVGGKIGQVAYNQYKNEVADKVTGKVTGYNPGAKPW
jgi:hypothetical protein